ncbi:MAG: AMP-binding protein [Rhodothermales bacterium]|nr:AMP-binding protein [Rhodothermales bacterium]MDG2017455.1 AMP-binding protein [Rhodothermales bacterium]
MHAEAKTFPFDQQVAWTPNPEQIRSSNLKQFMDIHELSSLDEVMQRSTTDIAWFWDAAIRHLEIEFEVPYSKVVDESEGPQFPVWCVDGRMNIVHNMLDKWLATPETAERTALRYESEEGTHSTYSYAELNREVCRCANALRSDGFGKGDIIGLFMPMTPELIFAFLAIIKVGGIILPLFSGYGPKAVATRLNDGGAVGLFTADGAPRRGKVINMKETADEALRDCPTVRRVVVQNRCNRSDLPMTSGRDVFYHTYVSGQREEAETLSTSAEDMMMLIYTSGTTGRPKGAVHTHCGFPIKSAQDMYHAMDVKPGETMYWMSDMGWMMGPWLVFGTLIIGASMVIYDGAPDFPEPDRTWQLVDQQQVTHLGLSPVLIRALMPAGEKHVNKHNLSALRAVGSTGSPWDPASWNWVFEHVLSSSKPILNYSGGTEISGGIVCGNFFKPLKPCSFSGPVPGMAADVVDSDGHSVHGTVGELIIRQPWIGMTRGFWKDKQRYLDSYWKRIDNTWVHGDFAAIDDDGLWFILGRSDDTIKVAGKRVGPAEVESIVNAEPEIQESAAIGIPHDIKGEELGVYVVLAHGFSASEELRQKLVACIVNELGRPLKPGFVRFTASLPKTRNAKVMRRVIQATYLGTNPGDLSSIESPASISDIQNAS